MDIYRRSHLIPLRCALSIATSDSGAGAGIQADLKTFAAHQVYGLSVLSAVTAQNTCAVTAMECLSPSTVSAQLDAVFTDIDINAVKIGLLGNVANTDAVLNFFKQRPEIKIPLILDPVMVSASGHSFLPGDAIEAIKNLMPICSLVTPNLPEAEVLSGIKIKTENDAQKASDILIEQGVKAVLIKGGHRTDNQANDLLNDGGRCVWFTGPKIESKNNHGTGCTLSSAIAANLAKEIDLHASINLAKDYVTEGMRQGISLGQGPGPLNHFHPYYSFAIER